MFFCLYFSEYSEYSEYSEFRIKELLIIPNRGFAC